MNYVSNTSEYRRLILRNVWMYGVIGAFFTVIWFGLLCALLVSIATGGSDTLYTLGLLAGASIIFGIFILTFLPYVRDVRAKYLIVQNSTITNIAKRSRGRGYPGFVYEINLETGEYLETFDTKLRDSLLLGKEYRFIYGKKSELIVLVQPAE